MGRRGNHTYEQLNKMIIDASFDLMEEEGHHLISTRKIAKRIGYTVGTLYIIFKNQEEIFLHINSKSLDILHDYIKDKLLAAPKNQTLEKIAEGYIKFANERFNLWSMLFEYRFSKELEMPKWYTDKINLFYLFINERMKAIFPDKTDEEISSIVSLFWSCIHGILVLSIKGKLDRAGKDSAHVLVNNFIQMFTKNYQT
jgi:AcrR family transcriptional regulator